jgi:hypothetical protein
VSRGPPFKQRLEAALDAARAAGAAHVKVTTSDGATFDFSLKLPPADELNDFDAIPPKPLPPRKHLKQ